MTHRIYKGSFEHRRLKQTHGLDVDAVLEATPPGLCEFCGQKKELRPYGPHGERICFDCGMQDKEATERRMGHVLFGDAL